MPELIEDRAQLLRRDANACVPYCPFDALHAAQAVAPYAQQDFARLRELEGVGKQVLENLHDFLRIRVHGDARLSAFDAKRDFIP